MMVNKFALAKYQAAYKKLGEALAESVDPRCRHESNVIERPYLAPFINMALVTIIWKNYGVIRQAMMRGLLLFYAHLGMDFAAPEGTELWATAKSVVVRVRKTRSKRGWGNYITLRVVGGYYDGLYYTFCHCQEIANLKKGDMVDTGDVVAWVGNTGNSTGPHVHVMCGYILPGWRGYHEKPEDCNIRGFTDPETVFNLRMGNVSDINTT
jgi:murein DD-endopeptidase MepM/ murein hydrolase activator NlpD